MKKCKKKQTKINKTASGQTIRNNGRAQLIEIGNYCRWKIGTRTRELVHNSWALRWPGLNGAISCGHVAAAICVYNIQRKNVAEIKSECNAPLGFSLVL